MRSLSASTHNQNMRSVVKQFLELSSPSTEATQVAQRSTGKSGLGSPNESPDLTEDTSGNQANQAKHRGNNEE
jgi:hypothetical protein